jgi:hypothetical protein
MFLQLPINIAIHSGAKHERSRVFNPRNRVLGTAFLKATTANSAATNGDDDDDPSVGIVIVDHGSRREASNQMLFEFVDLYK